MWKEWVNKKNYRKGETKQEACGYSFQLAKVTKGKHPFAPFSLPLSYKQKLENNDSKKGVNQDTVLT